MIPTAKVTIKDIANALALSHSTVSRALADHPKINSATKAKVHQQAQKMGYIPNGLARNMRGMYSPVIAVIVPDIKNDFYSSIAKIVADTAVERGFQLALSTTEDDSERELKDLKAFVVSRAAGIIITPTAAPLPETLSLLAGERHAIQLVRQHPLISKEAIVIADSAATHAATEHLIQLGHKRIAYIGTTTELSCGVDRLSGFQNAMWRNRLEPNLVHVGLPRPEFAEHAIQSLMSASERPTGLVMGSSSLTVGALKELQRLNLSFPKDISVVGYGDPEWFELMGPGLTTISLPIQAIGKYTIGLLLAQLNKEPKSFTQPATHFPASLIVRGSTRSCN